MKKTIIHIDRLALEGEGVGRLGGNGQQKGLVAFVPYVLPEESVEAEQAVVKKSFSRWLPLELKKSSPKRIIPRCPYHFQIGKKGPWCGGCNWQFSPVSFQRECKQTLVRETLQKIAEISQPPVENVLASPKNWGYRNKVQVPFSRDGKNLRVGFYAPGTHRVVEFDHCPIQSDVSNGVIQFVKGYAREHNWIPYEKDSDSGWIRHMLVRTNQADQIQLTLITKNRSFVDQGSFVSEMTKTFPRLIGIHQNIQPAKTNVILGPHWNRLWGGTWMEEIVAGINIGCSPGSFFQVNTGAAQLLYEKAVALAQLTKETIVVDLYCGVGCMTLIAAKKAGHVLGVEIVGSAVRDAEKNARNNKVANVEFLESKAESFFPSGGFNWIGKKSAQTVIFLDPPRSGCEPALIHQLLKLNPLRIVYISCHPATLARDIKMLKNKFTLKKVVPVDMFPQTSHIESIAVLEQSSS